MSWYKYGFGKDLLEYHPTKPFYLDYSSATFVDASPNVQIAMAIQRIVDTYPAPYTLLCSGGIDSQSMLLAWKRSGYPFKVVSARYNYGLNDYDLEQLKDLAQREMINVEFIDVDIIEFHENNLVEWAVKYDCGSPHILSHMYIASKITEGTVISSGVPVTRESQPMTYYIFGLERYAKLSGQPVIPHFWSHDQSLITIFENVNPVFKTDYERKCKLYEGIGLKVIPQLASYNGFEKIKEAYDNETVSYKLRAKYSDKPSKRSYDLMFRYSLLEHLKPTSEISVLIPFRNHKL